VKLTLVTPFDPMPRPGADGAAHIGGVERVFDQLSRRLAQRGHQVTLVCSSTHAGIDHPIHGLQIVRVARRRTVMRAPIAPLADHVAAGADIVHVPATYPFTTPAVLKRARDLKIPSVLDFHFEPHLEGLLGSTAAALYRLVGPRSYPLAKRVLVRSRSYGRSAKSLARVPEASWTPVPNGVDPQRFFPRSPAPEGRYLLFVGRLVPYKGLSVLFHALAQHPCGLPLVVAGDGPLRLPLEALARTLRLDVRFIGRVPDEALATLYQNARLTVLPSINQQEAFGISLLESMACGTPVVASDLPGVAELAALGGLVSPPGDPARLGRCIQRAVAPDLLPRGSKLADRVRPSFSWDAVTDRVEQVYRDVLAEQT